MYALYSRVSTKEQVEGYSIGEQQEKMKAYCKAKGYNLYEIYTDAGYSGGNIERPALEKLIADIKTKNIEAVIVYKLDRLSRSQKDTLNLIEDVFLANNCDFISISENFDTSSPFGRAMIGILSVFAQLEREQIKERMALGMEGRSKQGLFHGGGFEPCGYDYKEGKLVINPFEAEAVKTAFDYCLKGYSLTRIAKELNALGYTRKNGIWSAVNVKRTLENKLYTGIVKYNGAEHKGLHEPIISSDVYDQVQLLLETKYKAPVGATYLGGLLFCKKCGHRYTITGSKYKYYICSSWRSNKKGFKKCCDNKRWNMQKLDNLVFKQLNNINFETIAQEPIKPKIEPLEAEINNIDKKISKLLDIYLIDGIDKTALEVKIQAFKEKKEKIKQRIDSLNKVTEKRQNGRDLIDTWNKVIKNGTKEQVRDILHLLINDIQIDQEDIYINRNL